MGPCAWSCAGFSRRSSRSDHSSMSRTSAARYRPTPRASSASRARRQASGARRQAPGVSGNRPVLGLELIGCPAPDFGGADSSTFPVLSNQPGHRSSPAGAGLSSSRRTLAGCIGPQIDVVDPGQVPFAERPVVVLPDLRHPGHGRRRQPRQGAESPPSDPPSRTTVNAGVHFRPTRQGRPCLRPHSIAGRYAPPDRPTGFKHSSAIALDKQPDLIAGVPHSRR
jgi:hypothetical protein